MLLAGYTDAAGERKLNNQMYDKICESTAFPFFPNFCNGRNKYTI